MLQLAALFIASSLLHLGAQAQPVATAVEASPGFVDAQSFGFSPAASGLANQVALQQALDGGGTVVISQPGTYKIAGTVFIGSHTTLRCGNGVFLQKVEEAGPFMHVLLNKGALTKTWDEHIAIEGLQLIVNGVDNRNWTVFGLRGHLGFFYVRDLRISGFRCADLGRIQFAIHVCTFEDLLVEDVIIRGQKDGVHLGRGKRFIIRDGVFDTTDDAIALNAHDYATSNPELGWIEDGLVENCHDLQEVSGNVGHFCRILAGAWIDWRKGMEVQQSDTVVSNGRLYRVSAKPDGTVYQSVTQPEHESGTVTLDGIPWVVVQDEVTYTAGVRRVTFRNIVLHKSRPLFAVRFDNDHYSRSYYPGATIPLQEQLVFENCRAMIDAGTAFIEVKTPIDSLSVVNCSLNDNPVRFISNDALPDYGPTSINFIGCVFNHPGQMTLIDNQIPGKVIRVKTTASMKTGSGFSARVAAGDGELQIDSDLTGLH
ncbi:hypothetical protein [Actomonas aquatica]|uniref:Pectate lyase superfamily protein domain-containing protein n=1 Tax=Actomonas aquatica TaxID=2866162 RepID=A0ABZ1C553_9BACT|nr:hypothetical protein [Opitutus sp. WL0086]WRQ86734.1 hypothetical protein K1X11_018125 [Opitutus sp. WL0086]